MGAAARMRLAEPVHLLRQVGRVEVVEAGKRLETFPRLFEIANADQNVDDWLGLQTRHRGAADMVDAADDPIADRPSDGRPHFLKPSGRRRVIGEEADRLIG